MPTRTPSSSTVARIRTLGDQVSQLVERATDPAAPVPQTPAWSVAQVLAHLVTVAVRYSPAAADPGRWAEEAKDVPALNEAEVAAMPVDELPNVHTALRAALQALPTGDAVDTADPVPYTGGARVTAADLYGLMLGEFVLHGRDVAAVTGQPWQLEPADACEIVRAVTTILPAWVDPARAAGVTCVIELRIRGDRRYLWQFTDGALVVDPPDPRPVDVTISARPVGMLLLFYGRLPLWRGILTGQLRAWGRRPALAFRCNTFFRSP